MNLHEKNHRKRAAAFMREAADCAWLLMNLPDDCLDDPTFLTTLAAMAINMHARTHDWPTAISAQKAMVATVVVEALAGIEEARQRRPKRKTKRRARKPKLRLVKP